VEVVSVSSGEPSELVEVAQSSHTEGPATLMRVGRDHFQWGGPRLTWSDWNQLEAPPVFVLDDVEELKHWSQIQAGCQTLNQALSSALSVLHNDIRPAGQVCRAR
jgi:hypothetical protein